MCNLLPYMVSGKTPRGVTALTWEDVAVEEQTSIGIELKRTENALKSGCMCPKNYLLACNMLHFNLHA